jgi:Tol biopolymer transport system component
VSSGHAANWLAAATIAVSVLLASVTADAGTGAATTRVSVSSAGQQGNGSSSGVAVSAGGRYVAFESGASNLVPGDTNGFEEVFVHDRETKTTTRVSVGAGGQQGNGHSRFPAVSADGRYVGFDSVASNLVPGDTNAELDVFVRRMPSSP